MPSPYWSLCTGDWRGCYQGQYGLWAPESLVHPAKMAPGLAFRLLSHLQDEGYLPEGATVLDPMAGIGTSGLVAYMSGYPSILVELEPRFVALARANIARLTARHHGLAPEPIVLQGDVRRLAETLSERGLVVLTSPPYGEAVSGQAMGIDMDKVKRPGGPNHQGAYPWSYGSADGQIGALPDRPLVALTSPPYADHPSQSGSDPRPELHSGGPLHRQESEGQIAAEPESYLMAMLQVYRELAKVASVIAVVVKDPTRKGKLRLLGADTARLLVAAGFRLACWHRALLFEETVNGLLGGGSVVKPKGRISFFRRLQYRAGRPVADFEHVLVAVRVGDQEAE